MALIKTNNPVGADGSSDPRDLKDNASVLDKLINGTELEIKGRLDNPLKTIAALQNIITSLDVGSFTFSDITTGLAGTTDGQYFRVPQGSDSEIAFIYYENGAGSATQIAEIPGSEYLKRRFYESSTPNTMVPLFVDEAGKVPLWLEDGELNAAGVSKDMADIIVAPHLYEVKSPDSMVPIAIDEEGKVPIWLEDGKLNFAALHPDAGKLINAQSLYSSGETLWRYYAKKSNLERGVSKKLKMAFTGDSWTEHATIPQVFSDYFTKKYGKAGEGWIQLNIDNPNLINGVNLTRSGFSVYDASATGALPVYPTPADGQYIYSSTPGSVINLSSLFATSVSIYYYDNQSSFTYSVNNGDPVTVNGAGSNQMKAIVLSGLDITKATTLIVTTQSSSDVVIYGFYAEGSGVGFEMEKLGNGGITAPQYQKILPYIPGFAKIIDPDIIFMIIGTNDFRTSVSISDFTTGLNSWVKTWKTACPDAGIVLIVPGQSNASGAAPLSAFRDVIIDASRENGVEYFSLYDYMPTNYGKANDQGLWLNNLHMSEPGAQFLLDKLNNKFLEA